jgi:hypothetical protein
MDTIFRNYRTKQGEIWQVGPRQALFWTTLAGGDPPVRPLSAVCLSLRTDRHEHSDPSKDEPGLDAFVEVVARAARAWHLRPERIEVDDARLAEELGTRLAAEKVPVVVRPELQGLRDDLERRRSHFFRHQPPSLLSMPGVTVERLAAFARAAARFAEAAPWRHLDSHDLVVLQAPDLPPELQCVRLLGPPAPGVLFEPDEPADEDPEEEDEVDDFDGLEDDEEQDWEDAEDREEEDFRLSEEGLWSMHLHPPREAPSADVEDWVAHDLPFADAAACPVALRGRSGEVPERPDALLLSWFEAVLTALASTTEEEMDRGAWERDLVTSDGPVRLELTLPDVLLPAFADDILERDLVRTPEAVADDLIDEALEVLGRRQISLARRAVALWPDGIDAWLVLARRAVDRGTARNLYAEAVAAGERLMPSLVRPDGPYDDLRPDVVPWVWACVGLARILWDLGAREEAIAHLQRAVLADPRESSPLLLAYALLAQSRYAEAEDLLNRTGDDSAHQHAARALLTFRQEGDSPAARRHRAEALREDRQLVRKLLGTAKPFVGDPPDADIAFFQEIWQSTDGALDWLQARPAAPARPPGRSPGRKKKGKKKKNQRSRRRR